MALETMSSSLSSNPLQSRAFEPIVSTVTMRRIAHVKHLTIAYDAMHTRFLAHLNPNKVESLFLEPSSSVAPSKESDADVIYFLKQPLPNLTRLNLCTAGFTSILTTRLTLEAVSAHITTLEEIGFKFRVTKGVYAQEMRELYKRIAMSNPGLQRVYFHLTGTFSQSFDFLGISLDAAPTGDTLRGLPRRCETEMGIPISKIRFGPYRLSFAQLLDASSNDRNIDVCEILFNACHSDASIQTISSIVQEYLSHIFSRYDTDATTGSFLRWLMAKLQHFLPPNESVPDLLSSHDPERISAGIEYLQAYLLLYDQLEHMVRDAAVPFGFGPVPQPQQPTVSTMLTTLLESVEKLLGGSLSCLPQHLSLVLLDNMRFVDQVLSSDALKSTHNIILSHIIAHHDRLGEAIEHLSLDNVLRLLHHPAIESAPNVDFGTLLFSITSKTFDPSISGIIERILTLLQKYRPEGISAPVFVGECLSRTLDSEKLSTLYGSCFTDCDLLLFSTQFAKLFDQRDEKIPNLIKMFQAFSKRFCGSETITGDLKESLSRFLYLNLLSDPYSPPLTRLELLLSMFEPPRIFIDSILRSGLLIPDRRKRPLLSALKQRGYL